MELGAILIGRALIDPRRSRFLGAFEHCSQVAETAGTGTRNDIRNPDSRRDGGPEGRLLGTRAWAKFRIEMQILWLAYLATLVGLSRLAYLAI